MSDHDVKETVQKRGRGSRPAGQTKRGRPPKFGRPSQVVALTLPADVVERLRDLHHDLAWAIVGLVERTSGGKTARPAPEAVPPAELVYLPGGGALIVVQPQPFAGLRGVSTIPLADGRAFLAFEGRGGIADLEVAILDRMDELPPRGEARRQLAQVRDIVRAWRRESGLLFRTPHIIVVEHRASATRRTPASIDAAIGELRPKRR